MIRAQEHPCKMRNEQTEKPDQPGVQHNSADQERVQRKVKPHKGQQRTPQRNCRRLALEHEVEDTCLRDKKERHQHDDGEKCDRRGQFRRSNAPHQPIERHIHARGVRPQIDEYARDAAAHGGERNTKDEQV